MARLSGNVQRAALAWFEGLAGWQARLYVFKVRWCIPVLEEQEYSSQS